MSTIVVYPGRFHPFHRGHFGVYKSLAQQWGAENVYVATSDKQAPVTSPFTFGDKQDMMIKLGVPGNRIVKVKNPYQAAEVTKDYNPEQDRLIFALGAKDAERISFSPKKDGSASYMQPLPKDPREMKPFGEHAYVTVVPTVTFRVAGADANSATQIRERYIKGNDDLRDQIIMDLYGDVDPKIRAIFDARLDTVKEVTEFVYEQRQRPSARGVALVERILKLERAVQESFVAPDYTRQFLLIVNGEPIAKYDTPEEAKVNADRLHRRNPDFQITIGQEQCDVKMIQRIAENLQSFLREFDPTGYEQYTLYVIWGNSRHKMGTFGSLDDAVEEAQFHMDSRPDAALANWAVTDSRDVVVWEHNPAEIADQMRQSRKIQFRRPDDYIEEKWSEKYKRSINCSNPRGFSQRAHCQGRKKK